MKRIPVVIILGFLCSMHIFAQNGVIKEMAGTVEIKRAGAAAFVAAKVGDTIAKDTIVSTGFKSSALITVGSTVLTVRPLTRLTLAEISASAGTETINVNLQTGRVRVDVEPPAGTRTNTSVQGPSATASVRGTSFEFDTYTVTVLEGTVAFQGTTGGAMMVGAGGTSEVTPSGRTADPVVTSAAELTPPPYAGSATGYRHGVHGTEGTNSVVPGDFDINMVLH